MWKNSILVILSSKDGYVQVGNKVKFRLRKSSLGLERVAQGGGGGWSHRCGWSPGVFKKRLDLVFRDIV